MTRPINLAALLFLLVAIVVFVFADGLRRWYSGLFFLMLAAALYVTGRRSGAKPADAPPGDTGP